MRFVKKNRALEKISFRKLYIRKEPSQFCLRYRDERAYAENLRFFSSVYVGVWNNVRNSSQTTLHFVRFPSFGLISSNCCCSNNIMVLLLLLLFCFIFSSYRFTYLLQFLQCTSKSLRTQNIPESKKTFSVALSFRILYKRKLNGVTITWMTCCLFFEI